MSVLRLLFENLARVLITRLAFVRSNRASTWQGLVAMVKLTSSDERPVLACYTAGWCTRYLLPLDLRCVSDFCGGKARLLAITCSSVFNAELRAQILILLVGL